jgi:hypothetical protein
VSSPTLTPTTPAHCLAGVPIGPLRHLIPYLRRHRTVLILGGVSVVAMNVFQVWSPWLVR